MKIFISHSSKNAKYGRALVKLLTEIGVSHDKITFTSDTSYGIPSGENIFDWLKERISEKPLVIYLLSKEYFSSVACLNEMGAAWMIENEHITLFTPDFDIESKEFQSGVLDPREMGFRLNDSDRLTEFTERMKILFALPTRQLIINRACEEFLSTTLKIDADASTSRPAAPARTTPMPSLQPINTTKSSASAPYLSPIKPMKRLSSVERFLKDFEDGKLKDEEVLIVYYAWQTSRFSLGVGWRTEEETKRISEWEELYEYSSTLSKKYEAAITRLEVRNLTEVSERTSHGNPRQVDFVKELKNIILYLPESLQDKAEEIIQIELEKETNKLDDPFSF